MDGVMKRESAMVAYSFQPQFIAPILSGRKMQTMRGVGRRKHAYPGDDMQLYTGMRTAHCRLIGLATCSATKPIVIRFSAEDIAEDTVIVAGVVILQRNDFAKRDGFRDWPELRTFWGRHHTDAVRAGIWDGLLITWKNFQEGQGAQAA